MISSQLQFVRETQCLLPERVIPHHGVVLGRQDEPRIKTTTTTTSRTIQSYRDVAGNLGRYQPPDSPGSLMKLGGTLNKSQSFGNNSKIQSHTSSAMVLMIHGIIFEIVAYTPIRGESLTSHEYLGEIRKAARILPRVELM